MRSPLNATTPLAAPGEFHALRLGALEVYPPVVLAPMAGITSAPYRTLCRRLSRGRGLYVSEMITARAFVEGHAKTLRLAAFAPGEAVKSIQLYGTRPDTLAAAARTLAHEWGVHHIDLNFGCPVPKVTGQGGGAAIPARPRLMAQLVGAVVRAADPVPVTVKFRKGLDDGLLTFLDAGRVAQEEGARAVALHARTAAQLYSGEADWPAIATLKAHVARIPVLGNGDIFEAQDALRMMRATGCDGVVVGRGCLGRPWLFGELADAFDGVEPGEPPALGAVARIVLEHARLLAEFFGERSGVVQLRKFFGWYFKGFPGMRALLPRLHQVTSVAELEGLLAELPGEVPFPEVALRARRGKGTQTQRVKLPQGFLACRAEDALPAEEGAEVLDGG